MPECLYVVINTAGTVLTKPLPLITAQHFQDMAQFDTLLVLWGNPS